MLVCTWSTVRLSGAKKNRFLQKKWFYKKIPFRSCFYRNVQLPDLCTTVFTPLLSLSKCVLNDTLAHLSFWLPGKRRMMEGPNSKVTYSALQHLGF